MTKISIRFFNDREVRAIWDEENSKWWYSVPDIIGVLNGQDDYTRNRNYWKYLKTKLKKEGNEVVSGTNQLKLHAPDGKMRLTDVLDAATQTHGQKSSSCFGSSPPSKHLCCCFSDELCGIIEFSMSRRISSRQPQKS